MKTTPIALSAALISFALVACAAPEPAQTTPVSVPAAAKTKAKTKPYPLDTCIVTDNELDSMGGEITKVYDGQEIKFCCKPCVRKFEANKPKYLAKLK